MYLPHGGTRAPVSKSPVSVAHPAVQRQQAAASLRAREGLCVFVEPLNTEIQGDSSNCLGGGGNSPIQDITELQRFHFPVEMEIFKQCEPLPPGDCYREASVSCGIPAQ